MFVQWINIDFSHVNQDAGIMVLVGYLVVFLSLVSVYLVFRYVVPSVLRIRWKKIFRSVKENGREKQQKTESEISGEVNAAISMALFMHFNEIHDEESNIITIRKVARTYSPWSSKIYNMRNLIR